ncbi:hypothetical protein ANCCEY_09477 [Ancylostoma ceylanicum]|uniref:MGAT4 conserved region domain-containing protein n=1 Tax=Ancylostoma ceylanicum TaxID=53326 RepID=A0A0D6LHH0_9BILA|nr:hypothetical protein ANCCEY_09477 [Ancylostoma ceylanicum]
MTYGCQRANFYLQVEDDIEAAPEYLRVIKNYIKFNDKKPWFLMEFSELGFIGKLFRCVDVKAVTSTIALYYRFKPVDWILDDMLRSRYCALGEPHEKCLAVSFSQYLRGIGLYWIALMRNGWFFGRRS